MRAEQSKTRYVKGFFWIALLILFVGSAVAFLLSLDKTNTAAHLTIRITLLLTVSGAVLCVICATSDWWLKR